MIAGLEDYDQGCALLSLGPGTYHFYGFNLLQHTSDERAIPLYLLRNHRANANIRYEVSAMAAAWLDVQDIL